MVARVVEVVSCRCRGAPVEAVSCRSGRLLCSIVVELVTSKLR